MALETFTIKFNATFTPTASVVDVAAAMEKRFSGTRGTDETDIEYVQRFAEEFIANEFKSVFVTGEAVTAGNAAAADANDKVKTTPKKDKPPTP